MCRWVLHSYQESKLTGQFGSPENQFFRVITVGYFRTGLELLLASPLQFIIRKYSHASLNDGDTF
jgi:hypothetical protein